MILSLTIGKGKCFSIIGKEFLKQLNIILLRNALQIYR